MTHSLISLVAFQLCWFACVVGASPGWPSSAWMVALWVAQAATLTGAMSWMAGRYILGALFGAAGGPLAYPAGVRVGAAILGPSQTAALIVVAVEWAVAMPSLLGIARQASLSTRRVVLES